MRKLAVVVALLAATPAFATNGLRMTGFGPVNASMGGAGAAMGMDSSAMVLNPATMADLGSRVDFGAAYFPTTIKYSATDSYIGTGNPQLEALGALIVNQPNVSQTSDFPAVPIPNIGVVIPLAKEWRLGLGMAAVAGAGTDYPANLFSSTVQTTYFNFRFPIALSWQILDMLAVGATVNGSWALMGYSFGTSFGLQAHEVTSSFGTGLTLGAKVKALPFLSVGAAWESPTWFQPFKYNVGCSIPGAGTGLVTVPPPSAACPAGGYPGGREELQMNLPWNASLGVEVDLLGGDLLVLGDVQYIAWSTTLGKNQPAYVGGSATLVDSFFPFNTNWDDQIVYKIGAQLRPIDWLKIRAGFNYGKSPQDPTRAFENIAFPAFVESHVTLGLGLQLSSAVTLNLASVIGLEKTISGTGPLPNLGPLFGQTLPPATLTYSASSAGYTVEAGLSVTY